jgi:hypothetical protein
MKSLLRVFLLAIMAAGVASCSLFDVEIDTTFDADLAIEVEEPVLKSTDADSYPFQASATIDVLDDEDVYEYQDKIDDFIVSGVTAKVTWVTPEQGAELLPQTTFTITNGKRTVTWTLTTSMPLEVGTSVNLEDLGDTYKTVSAILADMKPFTVSAVGSTNVAPVSAVIRLGINTKVIANPLN